MPDRESADNPQDADARQYHVGVAPGEVAEAILLVGDPSRVERVAARFSSIELERRHREYVTITGVHEGLRVSVVGTGMGADNTEIAIVELCQCVEDPVMIRCGSSGGLQPELQLGELVISRGALRLENTSLAFVDAGYPAAADAETLMALVEAADTLGHLHTVGLTATAPGFYGAQGREIEGFLPRDPQILDKIAAQGISNLEMETSCLFTLASLRGFRAGAVCAVYANRPQGTFIDEDARESAERACTQTGLAALHVLARMDQERGDRPHWHPGLVNKPT